MWCCDRSIPRETRSITWLVMPWLHASPGHQQQCYWVCKIVRSFGKVLKCLHLSFEKQEEIQEHFQVFFRNKFSEARVNHAELSKYVTCQLRQHQNVGNISNRKSGVYFMSYTTQHHEDTFTLERQQLTVYSLAFSTQSTEPLILWIPNLGHAVIRIFKCLPSDKEEIAVSFPAWQVTSPQTGHAKISRRALFPWWSQAGMSIFQS